MRNYENARSCTQPKNIFFQFVNEPRLLLIDSNGEEHVLKTVGNNTCDAKNPFVVSDVGEINDKANLPVVRIRYGPLKHENSKVNITLGPLTCIPSEGKPRSIYQVSILYLGIYI